MQAAGAPDWTALSHRALVHQASRGDALKSPVLLNLLSNAVKYNRPGGSVTLTARAEGPLLRLDVADTGVGIADERLQRLFEPFQSGAHQASTIEGTGIGQAVSHSLALSMGGRLEVFSRPGEGSVFSQRLPAG